MRSYRKRQARIDCPACGQNVGVMYDVVVKHGFSCAARGRKPVTAPCSYSGTRQTPAQGTPSHDQPTPPKKRVR